MRRNCVLLLLPLFVCVSGAIDASNVRSSGADTTKGETSARFLKSTTSTESNSMAADLEKRMFSMRVKNVLRFKPVKSAGNMKGVQEAQKVLNSVMNGKKVTRLTSEKLHVIESYAHSHKTNWLALMYYIATGLSLLLFVYVAYGALFLGYRPYGMGGAPRSN